MLEQVIDQIQSIQLLKTNIEEIRLNPVDIEMLRKELEETSRVPIHSLGSITGVKVVSDESVQVGKMHIVKGL